MEELEELELEELELECEVVEFDELELDVEPVPELELELELELDELAIPVEPPVAPVLQPSMPIITTHHRCTCAPGL